MPVQAWSNDMRAAIAQMVGAMRSIQGASLSPDFTLYLDALLASPSMSVRTRMTLKNLFPAVLAMADGLDDTVLAELGIDTTSLPIATGFPSQTVAEIRRLQAVDFVRQALTSDTAHALTVVSKPFRQVTAKVSNPFGVVLATYALPEIVDGRYSVNISWLALQLMAGEYFIEIDDGLEKIINSVSLALPTKRRSRVI